MLVNFFGVEFLRIVSKSGKRKRKLLFSVPVLSTKRENVRNGKELCEKARCMCKVVFLVIKTYWFIAVLVAVAVDVA